MADEFFNRPPPTEGRMRATPRRGIGVAILLSFVGGAALVGWLVWDNKLKLNHNLVISTRSTAPVAAVPSPPASTSATAGPALDAVDQRVAALEQRLARIDLQASAAEGNATRAEALLVASAARRAIEHGAPLGTFADQLKLRFGNAQPNAVATLIESAAQPVTLDLLAGQLDALEPTLTRTPVNEDSWSRIKRELSGLFVIRRDAAPAAKPESRLDRARLLLRTGQIDAAIKEVQSLPGAAGAKAWIGAAQRYAMAERALDLIETTALLDPAKLGNEGEAPGPQVSPASPRPTPQPGPNASPSAVPEGAT